MAHDVYNLRVLQQKNDLETSFQEFECKFNKSLESLESNVEKLRREAAAAEKVATKFVRIVFWFY